MLINRRKLARIGVVLALVLAFQVTGPLLDHHFLERLPTHVHHFLDGVPKTHDHSAGGLHTHDDTDREDSSGVVFLPSPESMLQLLSLPSLVLPALLLALMTPGLMMLISGPYASGRAQATPKPATPPPRAVLLSSP